MAHIILSQIALAIVGVYSNMLVVSLSKDKVIEHFLRTEKGIHPFTFSIAMLSACFLIWLYPMLAYNFGFDAWHMVTIYTVLILVMLSYRKFIYDNFKDKYLG